MVEPNDDAPYGQLPVEDSAVLRSTAEEVRRYTKITTKIEVALIVATAIAMVISGIFTAFNTYKLRDLVERAENQRRSLTDLTQVVQTYNEDHAKQAENSFRTLHESQKCAILKLFTGTAFEKITPEEIAACYSPVDPAPPPPNTPTTRR